MSFFQFTSRLGEGLRERLSHYRSFPKSSLIRSREVWVAVADDQREVLITEPAGGSPELDAEVESVFNHLSHA